MLSINPDGFVVGINYYMYASNNPAMYQITELLPLIKVMFPDANGILYPTGEKLDMEGNLIVNE